MILQSHCSTNFQFYAKNANHQHCLILGFWREHWFARQQIFPDFLKVTGVFHSIENKEKSLQTFNNQQHHRKTQHNLCCAQKCWILIILQSDQMNNPKVFWNRNALMISGKHFHQLRLVCFFLQNDLFQIIVTYKTSKNCNVQYLLPCYVARV